jgi:hypothetical protein
MSPVALHMKLVSSQLTSRVAQHRLNGLPASRAAIQQAPRHVMRATKLEELENSVKDGAFGHLFGNAVSKAATFARSRLIPDASLGMFLARPVEHATPHLFTVHANFFRREKDEEVQA